MIRTLADLYSDEAWDAAIARRNITWARLREAEDVLRGAEAVAGPQADLRPHRAFYNAAQRDYEYAARDLIRARVWHRAARRRELPIAV